MSDRKQGIEAELENLQRDSFNYFVHETNPANGLLIDKTAPDWPASIAATGPVYQTSQPTSRAARSFACSLGNAEVRL